MDGTLRRIGMSSVRCRYSEVGHSPCEISGTRDGTGRRRGLSARSRCRRRRRKTVCHLARFFGLFFFFHERYYDGTGPVAWRIGHAPGTRNGEENPSTWGGPRVLFVKRANTPDQGHSLHVYYIRTHGPFCQFLGRWMVR